MELNEEKGEEIANGDVTMEPPAPEPLHEEEPCQPAQQPERIADAEKMGKSPIWAILLISIWIIVAYGTFYYFLISHRTVTYSLGG